MLVFIIVARENAVSISVGENPPSCLVVHRGGMEQKNGNYQFCACLRAHVFAVDAPTSVMPSLCLRRSKNQANTAILRMY